jgi:hypothetical protein
VTKIVRLVLILAPGLLLAVIMQPSPSAALPSNPQKISKELFQTSDRCFACHNLLHTSSGEDVSIGLSWRPTMMANSARDPYWQAGVRREVTDHPAAAREIEDECAKCHMPMARFQSRFEGHDGAVFARLDFSSGERIDQLARDGVSCSMCHQIAADNLGTPDSFVGGFLVDTVKNSGERAEYGPYKIDDGLVRIMKSSSGGYRPTEGEHIRKSELCATCHTLITKALGPDGKVIGQLPEQMPYQEWLQSDFRDTKSCQSCHMPVVDEATPVSNTLGKPREQMGRHTFVGGNFFMLRMLNRYRSEIGAKALPDEFEGAANRTINHLKSEAARLSVEELEVSGGRLVASLAVQNLTGHKFPTAYPSRRAWLHVTVRNAQNRIVFESGLLNPDGSIRGNDNDEEAHRFEPHHSEIESPDQVQIYEDIMVGADNLPTTGLLTAVRFVKDNRLLPKGFDKQAGPAETAPQGEAMQDPDFAGEGDKIRYAIAVDAAEGPFTVDAELWFQPISYRWANNLRSYNSPEPQRFLRFYDSMSSGSAVMLMRVTQRSN